jgi:hypothetical protein
MGPQHAWAAGRPADAALERLEPMRRFARQHALEFLERQKGGPGAQLSEKEAMDVALEAQQAARLQIRKAQARAKRARRK